MSGGASNCRDDLPCQVERLEAYLQESLGPDEEAELLSHLDSCVSCRSQLDQCAAEGETWADASRYLPDEPFDDFSLSQVEFDTCESRVPQSIQIRTVLETLDPTDDPNSLGRIGPYEVTGVIGSGGMGVVLKGLDRSLDRIVAIKVLAPHLASSGAARQRFAREARAAAAVLHPNVIAIHSVSNNASLPYLVMPYLRGQSLQRRLDLEGPLSAVDVLRISVQVADGLAAAHRQGLVHRDIKPANILLEDGVERVAITDFGLARAVDDASMTRSGVIAGTPQYMSPEQARGEPIDARSDLFSLGSAMYAMCTGRSPFRAETSFGVLRRISDDQPRPIREINNAIPDWMCRLISGLQAKEPDQRYASANQVERLLRQCLSHLEQPEANPLPEQLLPERNHSLRWLLFATAIALLVTAIGWAATRPDATNRNPIVDASGDQEPSVTTPASLTSDQPAAMDQPETPDELAIWDDGFGNDVQSASERMRALQESSFRFFDAGPHARPQQESTLTLPPQESRQNETKP